MSPRSASVNEELRRRSRERLLQAAVELRDRCAFRLERQQHELLLRSRALEKRGRRYAKLLGDHGDGRFGAAVEENLAGGNTDFAIADLSSTSHRRES